MTSSILSKGGGVFITSESILNCSNNFPLSPKTCPALIDEACQAL